MKKQLNLPLTWLRNIAFTLVALLMAACSVFNLQVALRESQTRQAAAPATGRFVSAGDVEMFIQESGPTDGPAVLFTHGAGAWSGLWRATSMDAFAAAGFHCIAVDLPPFGYSQRPTTPSFGRADQAQRIIAVLDTLKIQKVILVGHSFGGGATVETALMIPDRVQALVLADIGGLGLDTTPNDPAPQPPSPIVTGLLGVRPLRNIILASTATNLLLSRTLLQALILDPNDATDEYVGVLQRPSNLQGSTDALGEWAYATVTSQEVSLSSDLANYQTLTMPTLLVWGDSDTTVPLAEGQYLNTIMPNSELIVMPGVNHIPHVEDAEQFNKIVLTFLDQHR